MGALCGKRRKDRKAYKGGTKVKKYIKLLILMAVAVATILIFTTFANAAIYTGKCGDNLKCTLDTSTGIMYITGTGSMYNMEYAADAPWYGFDDYIKKVYVYDGVTSVGATAFLGYSSLTEVVLADSVTSVGDAAFASCGKLQTVNLGNGVKTIGKQAFSATSIDVITIPKSVTSIGNYAFGLNFNLKMVLYTGTKAQWNSISIGTGNEPLTSAISFPTVKVTNVSLNRTGLSLYKGECYTLAAIVTPSNADNKTLN